MHFLLYVCLPVEEAKTSLQARKRVFRYLNREHFVSRGRFCGQCDWFCIGGRYSGMLNMLRLKNQHPRKFKKIEKEYDAWHGFGTQVPDLFKSCFPDYEGMIPIFRDEIDEYGYPDDAQLMDEELLAELKEGFNEYVTAVFAFEKPSVIFTDLGENEWNDIEGSAGPGTHWVVVIDYHG